MDGPSSGRAAAAAGDDDDDDDGDDRYLVDGREVARRPAATTNSFQRALRLLSIFKLINSAGDQNRIALLSQVLSEFKFVQYSCCICHTTCPNQSLSKIVRKFEKLTDNEREVNIERLWAYYEY